MVIKRNLAAFVRQLDILNHVELKQICLFISRFHTLQHHLDFFELGSLTSFLPKAYKAAYVGRWPSVKEDGSSLDLERARKGGRPFQHRFALVECRGDWKWHREVWDFKRHYKAIDICHACFATKNHGPYQHLGFRIL